MAHVLSVRLERHGDELRRTAHLVYGGEVRLPPQLVSEIGSEYRVRRHRGLAAIDHVLDDGSDDKLQHHLTEDELLRAGQALFEAVFGPDEAGWAPCFKRMFSDGSTWPTRHPVRLRIVTDDPQLRAMPWGIMAFKGDYFRDRGWTFEVGSEVGPRNDVDLSLPTGILLILPELRNPADDTGSESHLAAIREVVAKSIPDLHPDQLHIAKTREEVQRALSDGTPRIVYYYGHGELTPEGQPLLRIPAETPAHGEDRHRWNVHDVVRAFRVARPPDLVYLNGCRTGRGPLQSIASRLAEASPVVLAQPADALSGPASKVAIRFFRHLFSTESDPLQAATARDPGEPTTGVGWLPLQAFANYRSFSVRHSKHAGKLVTRPEDFDRHRQRERAYAKVLELVHRPERRVQAFVALGPPENHQHEVAGQLRDYIVSEDKMGQLLLGPPVAVSKGMFTQDREGCDAAGYMERRLKLNIGKEWRSDLQDALLSRAPARLRSKSRVLWLDWGVLARERISADLRDWLAFCSGRLSKACPADLRIVATLTFDVSAGQLGKVAKGVSDIVGGLDYSSEQFRADALDALGAATLREIADFLVDHGCDRNLVNNLATWMHRHTNGEYAPLRALIAEASRTTYVELHNDLARRYREGHPVEDW